MVSVNLIFILDVPNASSFALTCSVIKVIFASYLLFFNKDPLSFYTEPCLHKTPKRSLSRKSRIPTFSSPINDTETQQEIFWDSHSPVAHRLGNTKIQTSGHLFEACSGSVVKGTNDFLEKGYFLL